MEWDMNGSLYLFRWSAFKASGKSMGAPKSVLACSWDRWHSVEIESAADLAFATFAVEQGYIDMAPWGLS